MGDLCWHFKAPPFLRYTGSMKSTPSHKLYCYVDETGQDTLGQLFIVVAVLVSTERDQLVQYLHEAELQSGIGQKKWVRVKTATQKWDQYIGSVNTDVFRHKIFYSQQEAVGTGAFEALTVYAIAQAVTTYRKQHRIQDNYKLSVIIDGLKKNEEGRIGKRLRELGIHSKKVRGARDQSEPLIRLADRIAGLVRDAQNDGQVYETAVKQLEADNIIVRL